MADPAHHRHPAHQADQAQPVQLVMLADQDQPAQAAFPADPDVMVLVDVAPTDRKDQRVDQVHQARTVSQAVVALMANRDPAAALDQLEVQANQARPVAQAHPVVRDCPVTMLPTARAHRGRPSSSASTKCHRDHQQQCERSRHHVVMICARTH